MPECTVSICISNYLFRFSPSLFKQIFSSYDLSKKDAILWGINNKSVAKKKYCSFGDAVVEETGIFKLLFFSNYLVSKSCNYIYTTNLHVISE